MTVTQPPLLLVPKKNRTKTFLEVFGGKHLKQPSALFSCGASNSELKCNSPMKKFTEGQNTEIQEVKLQQVVYNVLVL